MWYFQGIILEIWKIRDILRNIFLQYSIWDFRNLNSGIQLKCHQLKFYFKKNFRYNFELSSQRLIQKAILFFVTFLIYFMVFVAKFRHLSASILLCDNTQLFIKKKFSQKNLMSSSDWVYFEGDDSENHIGFYWVPRFCPELKAEIMKNATLG